MQMNDKKFDVEEELMKFKQLFVEGLEYLKTINLDTDDFGNKKIRFSMGPDQHILPHALSQFGELQVNINLRFLRFERIKPEIWEDNAVRMRVENGEGTPK